MNYNNVNGYYMNSGYVHSGYQVAIQGPASAGPSNSNNRGDHTSISARLASTPASIPSTRPLRNGPGGPIRCGHADCPYSGYQKDVEIHRMDRHLIFPPGYKPKKGPPDGDVGPNKAIPGTGIVLNTPDAIDAWIAERRKKWPTAERVAEKVKRKAEAIERGELDSANTKRPRFDGNSTFEGLRGRGRGRGRGVQRARGRGGVPASNRPTNHYMPPVAKPTTKQTEALSEKSSDSDIDSGSDIDPEKDIISSKLPSDAQQEGIEVSTVNVHTSEATAINVPKPHKKRPPKQPMGRPHDPLIDRPNFFRKLLESEIQRTVSNLSQAIRFIVDNNFFEGVELQPGDADRVLITEIDSEEIADTRHDDSLGVEP